MPPREEYEEYLRGIWDREYITNNGPLVKELETKLKSHLNIEEILYLANGTVALQIAIKALALEGDIITTPFSYVATTSSIVWESCNPIFVDIDSDSFNINPRLIENAISEKTTAILATHVFGNPCDIESIQTIADEYDLKVIYDAAHCFGTLYKGESVFNYGDISTSSFHATKLFHTVEGGAVFSSNERLMKKMSRMRNFGHDGAERFKGVGINGKNSEFHAAMGLVNLNYIDDIIKVRKEHCSYYDKKLGDAVKKQIIDYQSESNHSYYPVVFSSEKEALKVKNELESNQIFPRRYFYPSLDTLDYIAGSYDVTVSKNIAASILCLPLFYELTRDDQDEIASRILNVIS
mgnify:CR=1 FL=1